ncbi:MAG: ArnT family glycosyltransferase [Isosphaeraceae bacterium]
MQSEPSGTVTWERSCRQCRLALKVVLLAAVLLRLVDLDQPIVENYVGRQVPTAMVARNLERGSGFLRPQLDTAPSPNYFMVEPPVYQLAVGALRRLLGWRLEWCGRAVSALATALGTWGLFELVRRRDAGPTGLVAAVAFVLLPVTIRYGRAFQPDALMLGMVVAGLACWESAEQNGRRWQFLPAWGFLAIGCAAKITAAFVLVPLAWGIIKPPRGKKILLAASALVPVLLWYVWANHLLESGEGSRASAENRAIWLAVPGLLALGKLETLRNLGRFLIVRAFTPPALLLAIWGVSMRQKRDDPPDIWRVWAASGLLTMALLAEKLHHEYYWLCLAPVVAAGLGRAVCHIAERHRGLACALVLVLLVSSFVLVRSTWQTPGEWQHLETAAARIREIVPEGDWLVAAEPLLYQADRRGCRLEFTPQSAARAAAEWPEKPNFEISSHVDLIDFYRMQGARFVADLAPQPDDVPRIALREEIRRRYKVLVDDPSVIIAELNPSGTVRHGQ